MAANDSDWLTWQAAKADIQKDAKEAGYGLVTLRSEINKRTREVYIAAQDPQAAKIFRMMGYLGNADLCMVRAVPRRRGIRAGLVLQHHEE